MKAHDLLSAFADCLLVTIGGPPGSRRWQRLTACMGWGALLAFLASLLLHGYGQAGWADWALAASAHLLKAAIALDGRNAMHRRR